MADLDLRPFAPGESIGIPWPVVAWEAIALGPKLLYGIIRTATADGGCELTRNDLARLMGRSSGVGDHLASLRDVGLLQEGVVHNFRGPRIWIPVEIVADPRLHAPAKVLWGVLALCNFRGFAPEKDKLRELVGSPPWSHIHVALAQLKKHNLALGGHIVPQTTTEPIAEGCAS